LNSIPGSAVLVFLLVEESSVSQRVSYISVRRIYRIDRLCIHSFVDFNPVMALKTYVRTVFLIADTTSSSDTDGLNERMIDCVLLMILFVIDDSSSFIFKTCF
jgi:hypothetical protein